MIAYLGTGLLGANFVKALLKRGEQVNVWNRTFSKAKALETQGAKAFERVEEAVKGATRIHLTVSDDAAVDTVLAAAESGLTPGAWIVDHTTTSTKGAEERTRTWKARGFTYIHAPVFMGPQNALESTGYMLVSGDQKVLQQAEVFLTPMTGKLINFGNEVNKAAAMKLMGNSFLLFLTAGLSDTLGLAKAMNVPASDLVNLFDHWNPGAMVPGRLKRILAADFENPSWELNMARKDTRLMMEEAAAANQHLATIPAIAKEMDKWINKGDGNKDWTVIAKENL